MNKTTSRDSYRGPGARPATRGRGASRGVLNRALAVVVSSAMVLLGVPVLTAGSAQADTQPAAGVPATASAKALPTWQINGVGWSQVVVGNTVYVTGKFATARPPGVACRGRG